MSESVMTLTELRKRINSLPQEERAPFEALYLALGGVFREPTTKPPPGTTKLTEYHLEITETCITCTTKTKRLYWMQFDRNTNALISQTRVYNPEHLINLKSSTEQTAWCNCCENELLKLDKLQLIQMIKNRRYEHAKDHRLYKDTRGRLPAEDPRETRGGKGVHPARLEVRGREVSEDLEPLCGET